MKWIVHPDVRDETDALEFCREFAEEFVTDRLDWVRIDLGRGKYSGAYGRCWYPTKNEPRQGFRISIQVPGPFPYRHLRYVKPIYQLDDGIWPPIPPGTAASRLLPSGEEGNYPEMVAAHDRVRIRDESDCHCPPFWT